MNKASFDSYLFSFLMNENCGLLQYLCGRVRRWNCPAFSNAATARALDDFPVEEPECDPINMSMAKVPDFLNSMEQRGIQANHQTYLLLLSGCLNSGSLTDAKKLDSSKFS